MTIKRAFSIIGAGQFLPKTVLASSNLEKKLSLPRGWIHKYLGVEFRHVANKESNSYMGAQALANALDDAGLNISDIDCLIGASATFDHIIPNRSSLIKHEFKGSDKLDFPCLDINTVCLSFVSALEYASCLLHTEEYKNIAIVSSEIASKGLNPADPKSYGLFGDGAAAIIISKTQSDGGLIKHMLKTYTESVKHTIIEGGGNAYHPKDFSYTPELYSFKMEGKKLLKTGHKYLSGFLDTFFSETPFTMAQVDWIVPHQASKNGLKLLVKENQNRSDNIVDQLSVLGNCIAASIPLALVSAIKDGRIKEQDTCLLLGTAAGMSVGGLLFKYTSQ